MHENLIRILYHVTDCNIRVSRYCGVIPPDLFIHTKTAKLGATLTSLSEKSCERNGCNDVSAKNF